ncbi:hypothetical protein C0J52_09578 [Blattella germanica]|nr:hypothetical protein C0J52_09578 [Blattella germanica]
MNKVEENGGMNLSSGFRKCDIFPLNREEVLNRLNSRIQEKEKEMIQQNVSDCFLEHLIRKRTVVTEKRQVKRRRVNVTPGKSISVLDVQSSSHTNIPAQPQADTSTQENLSLLRLKLRMRATLVRYESNDSWEEESESEVQHSSEITPFREEDKVIGSRVIVTYKGKCYPGIITGISKKGTLINVMEQTGKHWRWPAEKDEILYGNKEIACKINAPIQRGKRSIYDVPEISQLILL